MIQKFKIYRQTRHSRLRRNQAHGSLNSLHSESSYQSIGAESMESLTSEVNFQQAQENDTQHAAA